MQVISYITKESFVFNFIGKSENKCAIKALEDMMCVYLDIISLTFDVHMSCLERRMAVKNMFFRSAE